MAPKKRGSKKAKRVNKKAKRVRKPAKTYDVKEKFMNFLDTSNENPRNRVAANEAFLRFLHNSAANQRNYLVKTASNEQMNSICECAMNIMRKNIPLTKRQVQNLRKYKKAVYKLADKSVSIAAKKKAVKQSGGVIPAILAPVLGLLLGEVAGKIFRK
jgi:hypothetical protein